MMTVYCIFEVSPDLDEVLIDIYSTEEGAIAAAKPFQFVRQWQVHSGRQDPFDDPNFEIGDSAEVSQPFVEKNIMNFKRGDRVIVKIGNDKERHGMIVTAPPSRTKVTPGCERVQIDGVRQPRTIDRNFLTLEGNK